VPDERPTPTRARERRDDLAHWSGARATKSGWWRWRIQEERTSKHDNAHTPQHTSIHAHEAMSDANTETDNAATADVATRSPELPNGLEDAFAAVAGELGQATASWIFVRAVSRCEGEAGVVALADRVGPAFPVLDAVARSWLDDTKRVAPIDPAPALEAIGTSTRLVVVGLETSLLDALLRTIDPSIKIALITHSPFSVDWDRVLDNFGGRVERVDLDTFQGWAGRKSTLLTFAYGRNGARTAVLPVWLRACGADVRSQFRALVAWDALGGVPLSLYPRWLVEVDAQSFTHFVR